jgi:hypothetical protein
MALFPFYWIGVCSLMRELDVTDASQVWRISDAQLLCELVLDLCKCAYVIHPHVYIRVRHTCVRHTHTRVYSCCMYWGTLASNPHSTTHMIMHVQNRLVHMIYFVMRMPMCTQHTSSDQAVAMGHEEQGSSESADLCGCDVRVFFVLLQPLHCFGMVFRFFFEGHARPISLSYA